MADRKSGPVKPPVIDLTARDAARVDAAGDNKPGARRAPAKPLPRPKTSPVASEGTEPDTAADITAEPAPPTEAAVEPHVAVAAESAKPAETPRSARQPSQASASPASAPPPPRPQARLAMPWSAISIAAIAGALVGTGLTYLLAAWIALPSNLPVIADPAPRLAEQDARIAGLEARFAALEDASINTQVSLDATITQLDSGFIQLRRSIDEVRAAMPTQVDVDLSGIEAELRTLEGRVEAVAAGASSADADALAQSLVAIERSLATLTSHVTEIDLRFATTDAAVETLSADLAAAKAAITAQSQSIGGADIGPAVKLPLVVSGLETAFATGRPYARELQSLTNILPDLVVPAAVRAAADGGLARRDDLAHRFSAALPGILGGRAGAGTGDWTADAFEWAKALLALRPAEEMEGDTPEAVVSRLEAAVERRDFVAAAELLGRLPEPMRIAAGPLGDEIATHAEAEVFIAGLRAQALAPVAEGNP